MYPPQSNKAPILANYTKFAHHFSIWTEKNGTLKLQQIAQNPLNSPILMVNPAELTKLAPILIILLFCFLDTHKTGSNILLVQITRNSQP